MAFDMQSKLSKIRLLSIGLAAFSIPMVCFAYHPQGRFFRSLVMYPCRNETCPILETELIPLTQGQYAIVSREDYQELSKYSWHVNSHTNGFRAVRSVNTGKGAIRTFTMHRQILGLKKGDKKEADHRNGYQLDNRRSNLRICSRDENARNRRGARGTSKYKGVYFYKLTKKWAAQIGFNKKRKTIGYFLTENAAAEAYNKAALKYHGEFACLNIIKK